MCKSEWGEEGQLEILGVVPVNWPEQADEWLSRLGDAFAEVEGQVVRGSRVDAMTHGWLETSGATAEGPLDTRLLTSPVKGGLVVAVTASEEIDPAAADAWWLAVRLATERLGGPGREFEWTALVGPPLERVGSMEAIFGEAVIGPFRVSCPEEMLRELAPRWGGPLEAVSFLYSWPLRVEGRHTGYNWPAASTAASMGLYELCALLSIGADMCLVVREQPAPLESGVRHVPKNLWWQEPPNGWSEDPVEPQVKSLPDWLPAGWQRMRARPRLASAATVYHEGLRAFSNHPSLALVAFIAAVEALANLLFKEVRCQECKAPRHVADRFRATLRLVLPDEEADRLGMAYSPRSLTVHQGRLFGRETVSGAFGFALHDPIRAFDWYTVHTMGRASAALLRLALQHGLPSSRVPFDPELHLSARLRLQLPGWPS